MNDRQIPGWQRWLGMLIAVVVLWPVTRILMLFGQWPRLWSIGMRKLMSEGLRGYVPDAGDVLVCSYFKSGTNWTMHIAVQIAHRGQARFEHIHDIVPWPEIPPMRRLMTVDYAKRDIWHASPTGLGVVKTHLPMSQLPYVEAAKYIVVVRDPKDVFVSSYHFARRVGPGFLMPGVGRWLDLHCSADTPVGSWAEHLDSGWRMRDASNVLFLTYEEMKADTQAAVERIAALMEVDLTAEELAAVLHQVSYEHMKSIEHKFDVTAAPWTSGKGAMIRRGQSGSSAELISTAEQARIDDYWRAELRRLGSDFAYDQAFGTQRSSTGLRAPP